MFENLGHIIRLALNLTVKGTIKGKPNKSTN